MRLSPKSIFFGLVAFGLPISVAIGWTLATPPRRPASVGAPAGVGGLGTGGGSGAIGTAPRRDGGGGAGGSQPLTEVQYSPRPAITSTAVPPAATAPSAAPTATTVPPVVTVTESSLPPLDEPPVPTPTEITTVPSSSADPSPTSTQTVAPTP
ncbi:hypothetical protein ACQP2F_43800 [Actinoplanes sp. CA-030573]|uniref:hypothetical protein n=1 Tax=Actinoplanes sp. CA-030573 TaxID=3239898 RepID=UPI003D949B8D